MVEVVAAMSSILDRFSSGIRGSTGVVIYIYSYVMRLNIWLPPHRRINNPAIQP